jgi:hypothetical protein
LFANPYAGREWLYGLINRLDPAITRSVQELWLAETQRWAVASTVFPVAATASYVDPPTVEATRTKDRLHDLGGGQPERSQVGEAGVDEILRRPIVVRVDVMNDQIRHREHLIVSAAHHQFRVAEGPTLEGGRVPRRPSS